jgi:hypothetical protein
VKRAAVAMVLGLLAAHCAGGSGDSAPAPVGKRADDGGLNQANQDGAAPNEKDAACAGHDATDDPDDDGLDTNCDGADGIVGKDIYLSTIAGADTNAATPTAPLRTIAAATTLATRTHGRILVASGQYPVEKLSTTGGWAIYGGYVPSFLGKPKRDVTVLAAPPSGLFIDGVDQGSFAHLTVQSDVASDANHRSTHGIRSRAKALVLDDVIVAAGEAMHATAGKPGDPGDPDASQCASAPRSSWPAGASGDLGAPRAPADGTAGTAGITGSSGTARLVLKDESVALSDDAALGGADATRGAPGGPGGAGTLNNVQYNGATYSTVDVGSGISGVGGCPGNPGGPGQSGGAAAALLVLDGAVHATRSVFRTGAGGTGGDGGVGGAGGDGAFGSAPNIISYPTLPLAGECKTPGDDHLGRSCAAYGGRGGTGGTGGTGGAGAGGWTLGIVTATSAVANLDPSTTFELGRPGEGGASDHGRAPSGKSAPTFALP